MRQEMIKQARQGRAINRKKVLQHQANSFFFISHLCHNDACRSSGCTFSFDTNTANTITESLKEAIAYEMPLGTIQQWKQKALTVFEQKTTQSQQTQENEQIQQDTHKHNNKHKTMHKHSRQQKITVQIHFSQI